MLRVSYSDTYQVPLPFKHRFPMQKYELLREQLLYQGILEPQQLYIPEFIKEEIILITHDEEYWARVKNLRLSIQEERRLGFPQSIALVRRSIASASGTFWSSLYALTEGIGVSLAGGTHHAYKDRAEGFCILNDVAISLNYLIQQKKICKGLVIDLDVHQGNGTAKIFEDHTAVFTFSMHAHENYPFAKERSDLDISLPTGTGDENYLSILKSTLPSVITQFQPDIIYYIAGVDVLATDRLGKLNLTLEGCKKRDELVLELAQSLQIPIVVVMGGGYSNHYADIINAHTNTIKVIKNLYD
ncbi:MAG: histone deacetylase [Bacteroidia bacterium]|nr:histone deacetylase [Bacteroidia bacterium]